MANRIEVKEVLTALGEDFIVDIPAKHDGKGGYTIDYFELVTFLIQAPDSWVDRIVGYINAKDYELVRQVHAQQEGVTFAPALANLI